MNVKGGTQHQINLLDIRRWTLSAISATPAGGQHTPPLSDVTRTQGAQFEIRIDGTPRSYRDRKDFAMGGRAAQKQKVCCSGRHHCAGRDRMHESPWMFRNRRKNFPYGWASHRRPDHHQSPRRPEGLGQASTHKARLVVKSVRRIGSFSRPSSSSLCASGGGRWSRSR